MVFALTPVTNCRGVLEEVKVVEGNEADYDGGGLVEVKGGIYVKISDVFGIGRIVNSLVGSEIVRAFGRIVEIYGVERARTAIEVYSIKAMAKAQVETALVRQPGEHELLDRAAKRLALQECAKQTNLERSIQVALENADIGGAEIPSRPIEPDWLLRWMGEAQYASNDEVRSAWGRILASKARSNNSDVSMASLLLMSNLDTNTSKVFERFVWSLAWYGCFPWHDSIIFRSADTRSISMLEELGFVSRVQKKSFRFKKLDIKLNANLVELDHQQLLLSSRGSEIATAIFGSTPFDTYFLGVEPSVAEQRAELLGIIASALEGHTRPIEVSLKAPEGTTHFTIRDASPPSATKDFRPWDRTADHFRGVDPVLAELIASLGRTYGNIEERPRLVRRPAQPNRNAE